MRRSGPGQRRSAAAAFLRLRHPAQLVALAFAVMIVLGTVTLMIPASSEGSGSVPFLVALFTATSAVCVTGLVVVDTGTHWTPLGQVAILVMIQIGGFGIMALASLLAILVSRQLGLRNRLLLQSESGAVGIGQVRGVVLGVAAVMVAFEGVVAVAIGTRLWTAYDHGLGEAAYFGVFHAISAFNNAGFALFDDSLAVFVTDPWINVAVGVPIVVGGLGFPVLRELRRAPRDGGRWSLHTKVTLLMSGTLLLVGAGVILTLEWSNPATLGELAVPQKLIPSVFHSVTARTAGFHTLDVGAMAEPTLLFTVVLMFIGGGTAGTAGGIKVMTFAVLVFVIWAEARGEPDVNAMGRRIPTGAQRQALSVVTLALGAVVIGTLLVTASEPFPLSQALFETVSAFGITGLSTGITPDLSDASRIVLIVLMFIGRLGPITLATALALREKERRFRVPVERPMIG
jgi:trk system potassium uptake protein